MTASLREATSRMYWSDVMLASFSRSVKSERSCAGVNVASYWNTWTLRSAGGSALCE